MGCVVWGVWADKCQIKMCRRDRVQNGTKRATTPPRLCAHGLSHWFSVAVDAALESSNERLTQVFHVACERIGGLG